MALNLKDIKNSVKNLKVKASEKKGEVEVEVVEEIDQSDDKTEDITLTEIGVKIKQKPRLKPIQILIVLLLIAFLLMEDEITTDTPVTPPPVVNKQQAVGSPPVEEAAAVSELEPVVEPEPMEKPSLENQIDQIAEVVESSKEVEVKEDPPPATKNPVEAIEVPEPIQPTSNEIVEDILENSDTDDLLSQIQKELKQEKLLQKELSDKISDVSPPDYTVRGAALVRNCAGKHWACVNAPSFKKCKINYDWTKKNSRSVQCQPENIYASPDDCDRAYDQALADKSAENFCL